MFVCSVRLFFVWCWFFGFWRFLVGIELFLYFEGGWVVVKVVGVM